MKKYANVVLFFLFLASGCLCGCAPSPRMRPIRRGGRHESRKAENELPPHIVSKIESTYLAEAGSAIKVVKVHDGFVSNNGNWCSLELIIERGGKRYLLPVKIENVDGVPVLDITYMLEKEIK